MRTIDDIMQDFEVECTNKCSIMTRFFYEPWEYKLHHKIRKLFDFNNYLQTKMHRLLKQKRNDVYKSDEFNLMHKIDKKITDAQYHGVSAHTAGILYGYKSH